MYARFLSLSLSCGTAFRPSMPASPAEPNDIRLAGPHPAPHFLMRAMVAFLFFQTLLVSFRGPVKEIDKEQLRIETEQHETLTFRRTHKTKFLKDGKKVDPSTVTVGTRVTVDTEKDPSGGLVAVNVLVGK